MGAGKHTKLLVSRGDKSFHAVCFGMATSEMEFYPGEQIDLLCQISINEFRGQSAVQLVVQDIRLSGECAREYDSEEARYLEIKSGAPFSSDEDVLPTRADIAEIYRFFRQQTSFGHNLFNIRMLRSQLGEFVSRPLNYAKLRFAISILDDINVCGIGEEDGGAISVEVYKNAAKTNIELSETYKRLVCQCGD
jgi:single-stranded-DNA-specific exonuclease